MFAALGVILIVAGAIVAWGVDAAVEGLDLAAIGFIMIAGGVLSLLIAAIQGAGWMSTRKNDFRSERHVSPDGRHAVEETQIS